MFALLARFAVLIRSLAHLLALKLVEKGMIRRLNIMLIRTIEERRMAEKHYTRWEIEWYTLFVRF